MLCILLNYKWILEGIDYLDTITSSPLKGRSVSTQVFFCVWEELGHGFSPGAACSLIFVPFVHFCQVWWGGSFVNLHLSQDNIQKSLDLPWIEGEGRDDDWSWGRGSKFRRRLNAKEEELKLEEHWLVWGKWMLWTWIRESTWRG